MTNENIDLQNGFELIQDKLVQLESISKMLTTSALDKDMGIVNKQDFANVGFFLQKEIEDLSNLVQQVEAKA